MTVVQIQKPENTQLADWFAELRCWFDNNDCSPILFTETGRVMNKVQFSVKFADQAHARLFASAFSNYAPSIRQLISENRSEVEDGLKLPRFSRCQSDRDIREREFATGERGNQQRRSLLR